MGAGCVERQAAWAATPVGRHSQYPQTRCPPKSLHNKPGAMRVQFESEEQGSAQFWVVSVPPLASVVVNDRHLARPPEVPQVLAPPAQFAVQL